MRCKSRNRIPFAIVGVGLVYSLFCARLVDIQVFKHEEYAAIAAQKNSIRQTIQARRGVICDRSGEVLAANIPTRTVAADGSLIQDPKKLAATAAPFLEMDEKELAEKLTLPTNRKYVVIKRGLAEEKYTGLRKLLQASNQRGFLFEPTSARVYPNSEMLSHVIGFLDHENTGIQGIEKTMEGYLHGKDGFRYIERDRTGREIVVYRGQEEAAENGATVELTVDMAMQAILEEEIDNAYRELKPQSVVAILMQPKTGEILAMVNRPSFDLNAVSKAKPEEMKNRAIIDIVEPGSTFKIVVIGGGLNEGVVKPDSLVYCENGNYFYGGRVLRDHHGYGNISVHDVLMKSSNIGSAKIAMLLGNQRFYEYVKRYGFGERSGINLPGEVSGIVHPPHRWSGISITRIPMGHEVAVTPLQIVMAMGVIANGGKLMKPHIVRSVTSEKGEPLLKFEPEVVRQVISAEAAHQVNLALIDVVSPKGTASLAKVDGFQVGGKTGTAQRVDPKGGYTPGKYVVSFCGYMPAENPEFVGLVIVDDPQTSAGMNYGGLVAAPIFSRVAEKVARYLDLQPTQPLQPEIAQLGSPEARRGTQ